MKFNELIDNIKSKEDFISFVNSLLNDNQVNNDK